MNMNTPIWQLRNKIYKIIQKGYDIYPTSTLARKFTIDEFNTIIDKEMEKDGIDIKNCEFPIQILFLERNVNKNLYVEFGDNLIFLGGILEILVGVLECCLDSNKTINENKWFVHGELKKLNLIRENEGIENIHLFPDLAIYKNQ